MNHITEANSILQLYQFSCFSNRDLALAPGRLAEIPDINNCQRPALLASKSIIGPGRSERSGHMYRERQRVGIPRVFSVYVDTYRDMSGGPARPEASSTGNNLRNRRGGFDSKTHIQRGQLRAAGPRGHSTLSAIQFVAETNASFNGAHEAAESPGNKMVCVSRHPRVPKDLVLATTSYDTSCGLVS